MGFLKHNFIMCISINDVIKKLMILGAELMKPRISVSWKIRTLGQSLTLKSHGVSCARVF